MRNKLFPLFLISILSACGSSDFASNDAPSNITIPDNQRASLTQLPDIDFNGQYETTAPVDAVGTGDGRISGIGTDDSAVVESSTDSAELSSREDTGADSIVIGPVNPNQSIEPGTLTAGDYDDHLNPHLYQNYANDYLRRRGQSIDVPRLDFNKQIRVEVTTTNGSPYAGAKVEVVTAGSAPVITLHTAANGATSLYSSLDALPASFQLRVTANDGTTIQQDIDLQQATNAGTIMVTLSTDGQSQSSSATSPLDLMFVVDTTGSMTDELSFLQTELSDIINAITLQQSDIKIGLVFYRDYGDEYIVRAHEFSDSLNGVQLNLNQERAAGGGDYPEAMDQALTAAINADWRTSSQKVLFLIADAPPHSDRMRASWNAAAEARKKNIHMIPIAASGVAEDAEYIMRSMAALTNSRYLFLTDDSGYGSSHAEPEIDCYVVTSLRKAMRSGH